MKATFSTIFTIALFLSLAPSSFAKRSSWLVTQDENNEEITTDCVLGTYYCYGEGALGGDYEGPDISLIGGAPPGEEIGVIQKMGDFGGISVNITAPSDSLPGGFFREFEICRPDPLNERLYSRFPKFSCVTTVRNDENFPTVKIDMTFFSCNRWTKIVSNFGAETGTPGIFEVRCTKAEE